MCQSDAYFACAAGRKTLGKVTGPTNKQHLRSYCVSIHLVLVCSR